MCESNTDFYRYIYSHVLSMVENKFNQTAHVKPYNCLFRCRRKVIP